MDANVTGVGVEERLLAKRVVPVAVLASVEEALGLASALVTAGLPVLEVTLRTAAALECIRAIRQEHPEMLVGAGTVLEVGQVTAARGAGAQFGVAPGLNEAVVLAAQEVDWLFMPGVMTPSEVERALGLGCALQKFFPAEAAGGVRLLRALAGPYGHTGVRFVPLGGVTAANMTEYLAVPGVAAVGGTWLCERRLIEEGRWGDVVAFANEAARRGVGQQQPGLGL